MRNNPIVEALKTMGRDGATSLEAAVLLGIDKAHTAKQMSALCLRGEIDRVVIGQGTGKSTHEKYRYYTKAALRELKAEARAQAKAAHERVAAKLNGSAVQHAIAEAAKPEQVAVVVPKPNRLSPEGRELLVAKVKAAWARRKAAAAPAPVVRAGKKRVPKIPRKPFQVGKIGAVPWNIDTPYFTITITPKETTA